MAQADDDKARREQAAAEWRAFSQLLDQGISSIMSTLDSLREEAKLLAQAANAATLTNLPPDPRRPVVLAAPPPSPAPPVREAATPPPAREEAVAPPPPVGQDEEAAREELRRAVAAARAETERDRSPHPAAHDLGLGLSEGGFFSSRTPAPPVTPPPPGLASAKERAAHVDELPADQAPAEEAPPDEMDEEAAREALRRSVEAARAALEDDRDASPLFEVGKALLGATDPGSIVDEEDETLADNEPADEAALRDELRRSVEAARQELRSGKGRKADDEEAETAEAPDAGAVREQLRRAVAASRASIEAGDRMLDDDTSAAAPPDEASVFKMPDHQIDISMPLVVIDDPDGRVELVRVYRTLARLGCGSEASLVNYTPHGVTISIDPNSMPTDEEWSQAVEAIFERPCELMRESSHLRLRIARNAKAG
jgi:hypothetical protein